MLEYVNFTSMHSLKHFLFCEIDLLVRRNGIGNAIMVDKAFCEYRDQVVVLAEALQTVRQSIFRMSVLVKLNLCPIYDGRGPV